MKKQLLTLLALAVYTHTFAALTDSDADLVTQETSYNTHLTTFTELLDLQGDDRTDNVGSLGTDLSTLATAVTNLITANGGLDAIAAIPMVGADYRTRIETLQANITGLHGRVTDVPAIANMQQALFEAFNALLKLRPETTGVQTISELQTANAGHVTTAVNAVAAAFTAAQTVSTAGVGTVGGLQTALSQAEFDFEFGRLTKAQELGTLITTLPALNSSFLNSLSNRPDIEDEGLSFYDTALNDAQDIIDTAAGNLKTDAAGVVDKLIEIVATGPAEYSAEDADSGDVIPAIAERLKQLASNFLQVAQRQIDNSALTRNEVELRNLQRLLYFGDKTVAEKAALRQQIKEKYTEVLSATNSLESSFAQLLENDAVPTIAFPETPLAPAGSKNGIEQLADKQTNAEVEDLRIKIQILNDNQPPPPGVIEAGVKRLKPALKMVSIAKLMYQFTNKSANYSAIKRLADADDRAAEYTTLSNEWDSYLALATEAIEDPQINRDRTVLGSTTNLHDSAHRHLSNSKIQDLFAPVTPPSDTNFARRAKKALRFIKRFESAGNNAVLIVMNEIADELMNGRTVLEPTTTVSSEPPTPANTTPETNNATFDAAGDFLGGENLTRDELTDGSTLLIAGADATLEDPIIGDVVSKLTADVKFYVKDSGSISLGASNIDVKSGGQSPNVLGGIEGEEGAVQIIADGDCFVRLRSDIYITGSKPFVPTKKFGQGAQHRITFYADKPVALRVKKNVTWDLSDFGNTQSGTERGDDLADTTEYTEFGKQIAFAGQARLVLEPGAKVKFPNVIVGQKDKGVVLYFNEDSALVCEADLTNEVRVFEGETLTGTDCIRNKIMGEAQLWLNKNARWIIQNGAFVGIESSYDVPRTTLTLSLQGNSKVEIGTSSTKGGALQVGNMFNGGSKRNPHGDADANFPNTTNNTDGDFVPKKTFVNFDLKMDGEGCKFILGPSGFFGIAAGVINKTSLLNTWQVQRLYNVGNFTFDIVSGTFEHAQIATGSDASGKGSLLAIGPQINYPSGKYIFKMDHYSKARVRGGGNVMMVSKDANVAIDSEGALVASPHTVSIGNSVTPLVVDNLGSTNTGRYGILAPGYVIRSNGETLSDEYEMFGRAYVSKNSSSGRYIFAGPQEEMFAALTMPDILSVSSLYRSVVIGYAGSDITSIDGTTATYAYAYRAGNTLQRRSTRDIQSDLIDPYTNRQLSIRPEETLLSDTDGAVLRVLRLSPTTGKPQKLTTIS